MRCDYCVTLNQEFRRITNLVRLNNGRGSTDGRKTKKCVPYTVQKHDDNVIYKRKKVLHSLFLRYKNAQKKIAKGDPARGIAPRPLESIRVDEVVPDEDVENETYCRLLNERAKKSQLGFGITLKHVQQYELLGMSEDQVDEYLEGVFAETEEDRGIEDDGMEDDLREDGRGGDGENGAEDGEGGDDAGQMEDAEEGVGGEEDIERNEEVEEEEGEDDGEEHANETLRSIHEASFYEIPPSGDGNSDDNRPSSNTVARQSSGLLTALERLTTLRTFHNDHIT